ncbi:MAG: hypothetical protein H7Y61_02970 [Rhizobiales bacterium]|nr:hypothetical protein [Rhizobacter sp.]
MSTSIPDDPTSDLLQGSRDALREVAGLRSDMDDVEGVVRMLEVAQPLANAVGDPARMFRLYNLLACALGNVRDFDRSFSLHELSIEIARSIPDDGEREVRDACTTVWRISGRLSISPPERSKRSWP